MEPGRLGLYWQKLKSIRILAIHGLLPFISVAGGKQSLGKPHTYTFIVQMCSTIPNAEAAAQVVPSHQTKFNGATVCVGSDVLASKRNF
ncbi:hypothetical protein EV363DRAFT_1358509 [Boletus edulis]|uniref:Uncharacterized protein n=1 Tax=Boletus edulis BED1 TaxID=1328754 RepID=A0AAD4G852_BOLED|nr:hypothetical protein EV363DRAFT_1358509 [Boletus edulis]KAF8429470.1 hypothetical protein L210DRAFT_942115 [Boletus edulis BED1]